MGFDDSRWVCRSAEFKERIALRCERNLRNMFDCSTMEIREYEPGSITSNRVSLISRILSLFQRLVLSAFPLSVQMVLMNFPPDH